MHIVRYSVIIPALALLVTAAEPTSWEGVFAQSKPSLNLRLRYENVQQTNLLDARALTLRSRLGYTTLRYRGIQFSAELENITAFDGDTYNQSGLNPVASRRAVVADPETTELNQLWASFTRDKSTLTLGRQKLILDNARFIGDVGWRQNQQTFDGVVVQSKAIDKTSVTYAYIDQVNRVFSRRHAQGRWDSKSHLFNASFAPSPAATITGYAYLLDFSNSAANSTATYGVSVTGMHKIDDSLKFTYRAELATQSDFGSSALSYSAQYSCLEAGISAKKGGITLGYELLGSNNNVGFKTPLATLHAFNGWADLFLTTPAAGLRDTYIRCVANLPEAVTGTVFYHWFEAQKGGANFGTEFDAMLSRKFGKYTTVVAKFADYRRDSPAYPNVRKIWLQLDFAY